MRHFNYHYRIEFEETDYFNWDYQMGPVRYDDGYKNLLKEIPWIIDSLNKDVNTRQAILTVNTKEYMSCLINLQWLIDDGTLYCITNFRSQHSEWGRPQDSQLILYLCTQVKKGLEINNVKIEVNVADYHLYYT